MILSSGFREQGLYMITITDKEFRMLADYIKENSGINLKDEKKPLVQGRLYTVLQQSGFKSFTEYYEYVTTDKSGKAVVTLIDKITTNHTYFMRESGHFDFFRDRILPALSISIRDKDLRIWCAACSTGEESYTLAMIIDEFFGKEKAGWDTRILATDLSEKVLAAARKGQYSDEKLAPLPNLWRMNYFNKAGIEESVITDSIKNEVIYRKFNLMEPVFPFRRKFHVIFCRNVMIYFDNSTKAELVSKFYNQLENGGYLFIGHSETLPRQDSRFTYVAPAVYRKAERNI